MEANMISILVKRLLIVTLTPLAGGVQAGTYFVSASGSENGSGKISDPFRRIQQAADIMGPGDTCLVRGGTYREWVKPIRGGTSEAQRIVYRAYPGEVPVVKGSERITQWVRDSGDIWRATIPDAIFGAYNPFLKNVSGAYLNWGGDAHLGGVYLDGIPLKERHARSAFTTASMSWYTEHNGSTTTIWAQFDGKDPNAGLAEINVRETVFHPENAGLGYITLDGFTIQHGASNWAANTANQKGMVGTWGGRSWTIQNCHLSDSRCACLASTYTYDYPSDLNSLGHHLIRNNTIERCGQAGIVGQKGLSASVIEKNLIQDINYTVEFGGYESGGIKFHLSDDLLIKGNIIRRVRKGGDGVFPGIWIDWANQGIRITGNIFKDIDGGDGVFVEMNHGPNLIDNNVFSGAGITSGSDGTILTHNLFATAQVYPDPYMIQGRASQWYQPHSLVQIGYSTPSINLHDRLYNNIFISKGPSDPINTSDYRSGFNVYYHGALKNQFDPSGIVRNDFNPGFLAIDDPASVTIAFDADITPMSIQAPYIAPNYFGSFPPTNQGMEDRDRNPIGIDMDILGNSRSVSHPTVGPFEFLRTGKNSHIISAGQPLAISAAAQPRLNRPSMPTHGSTGKGFQADGRTSERNSMHSPVRIWLH